jgi:AcrR family transcriptional regulator
MSALYRRYRSKDELLQRLCLDGLRRYIAEAEAALADAANGDPWTAFTGFMCRCLDAGTSSLTLRFAGTFPTTEELNRAGHTAHIITQQLLDRAQSAGVLRADIAVGDLSLLFEQLQAVHVGDQQRTSQLRQRYLALVLDGLHIPHSPSAAPLPGPPPTWEEISGRYNSESLERD